MRAFLLGVVTVGAGAFVTSCSGSEENSQQQQVPKIKVETIEATTSELSNSFPAIVKGKSDVEIRPQVSGFITKVCVDEGQRVRKGQTLFLIDQVQFQAAVSQAREQVNSAQAAVNTATSHERNQRMLFDKGIISQTQWQNAADQLAQAKASLAAARAALTSAQKNLSYTVVTSPADGVVGAIPNREGSLASPSSVQPLTTVSDIDQVYAYFSLNEKDLLDLTDAGAKTLDEALASMPDVQLRLANGTVYPLTGRVATVSGVIDNATGSASVRALFDNTNGMLRSGSTGAVIIPVSTPNAIVIPQKATFEQQEKRFVYTVNDSNMTVATPIEVLDINDGQTFVVTNGLKPGDRIVVEGVGNSVRDGMPIEPVDAKSAAGAQPAQTAPAAK
ncbi:MAG: efflux RND transporter periplasmic adaptor subunit [Bacteroidales bacterium]|nr:efflux RND transporter periplasmic adaptor subunit [Bacteroidales bacterium]